MLRRWRSLAGVAATAVTALIMSAVGVVPVSANAGDIWTQPAGTAEETPSGGSQETHLPCGAVDIWAKDLDQATGTWTLFHMPPPSPADVPLASGTYDNWSGDHHLIATIPMSAFMSATGPHFKVEVENGNNKKSKVFWLDCKVSISTATNPSSAKVGMTLNDSATLSGGFSPTGAITFTLYYPTGGVAHTETVNVSGDGTYSTITGHVADQTGTWHWQAAYSGNDGNDPVTSSLADEPVTVNKAEPSLSTTPSPESPVVGDTLKDTAILSGGYTAGGSITFTLYDSGDNVLHTESVTVGGDGSYTTGTGFAATTAGSYHWKAEYSGDANNQSALSANEPVTVSTAGHSIITTQDPATATVGATLNDKATLSGDDNPTGTITFTLYDPTGGVAHTESVDVNGNGTYSTAAGHVASVVGTWHWTAGYSGDSNNAAAASGRLDEPVTVNKAEPSLSTTPSPESPVVGDTLKDTSTLSGGYTAGGSITFTLYDSGDNVLHTESVTVGGDGSYATGTGFVATTAGSYHWKAEYSGDANNESALSANEPVTVTETEVHPAQPVINTEPIPASLIVGSTLNDSATLTDGSHPTGTITFTLYNPSNTAVHTEQISVDGNGTYATAEGHPVDMVGSWHWSATFTSSDKTVNSDATSADEMVKVDPAGPAITTTPSPNSVTGSATLQDSATLTGGYNPSGTITFTLYDPAGAVAHTETVSVDQGNGSYTTVTGHLANTPGTWHWSASYSGDANNSAVSSLVADEPVTVTATGEVLAATGTTSTAQLLAMVLLGSSVLAILGAVAWRRREV